MPGQRSLGARHHLITHALGPGHDLQARLVSDQLVTSDEEAAAGPAPPPPAATAPPPGRAWRLPSRRAPPSAASGLATVERLVPIPARRSNRTAVFAGSAPAGNENVAPSELTVVASLPPDAARSLAARHDAQVDASFVELRGLELTRRRDRDLGRESDRPFSRRDEAVEIGAEQEDVLEPLLARRVGPGDEVEALRQDRLHDRTRRQRRRRVDLEAARATSRRRRAAREDRRWCGSSPRRGSSGTQRR